MSRRLLIVECKSTVAKLQKHIAISSGYQVDIATSLDETVVLIKMNTYFCAVVEFDLPNTNNIDVITKTVEADIPTIVMTSNLDKEVKKRVEKLPIIDYITKDNKQAYHYLKKQLQRLPRNEYIEVLVVDDSKQTLNYIYSLLHKHKYQIHTATNGEEALEMLASYPNISVIITDNEMPKMNGEELCNEIRRLYSDDHKAIIGISGSNTSNLSARFLKSGANDYLHKPFNPEEFYCRLSQNVDMLEHIATIKQQANTDYLTKLPNRRFFFEQVARLLELKTNENKHCTLAMIDIDHFKNINDEYGHDAGDDILVSISKTFKHFFNADIIARLGGEEFAVFFPQDSYQNNLNKLEQFRAFLENKSHSLTPHNINFTISAGYINSEHKSIDKLLKLADINLYKAKLNGRNQIVA